MKFLFAAILLLSTTVVLAQGNPSLSAVYDRDQRSVRLKWEHTDERITVYILQKSSDNVFFTDVYTKKVTELKEGSFLRFTDEQASSAKNYYRLKIFREDNLYEATLPVTVIKGNADKSWAIYPIPVGSVLHLQYTGSSPIEGVISIQIQNVRSGMIFNRMRMASNTRNIDVPVDNLGNGIYDIRVFVGNEVTWNQRFAK